MEMTFGFLFGLGLGVCAWRNRNEISAQGEACPPSSPLPSIASAGLAIALALYLPAALTSRLDYTIAGALLLSIALYSQSFAWQTAITATYCAFAIDLVRFRPTYPAAVMWTLVVITTLAVAVYTARSPGVRNLFLLMTWTSTLMSMLKSFLPPAKVSTSAVLMEAVFLLFALLLTWMVLAAVRRGQARRPVLQQP